MSFGESKLARPHHHIIQMSWAAEVQQRKIDLLDLCHSLSPYITVCACPLAGRSNSTQQVHVQDKHRSPSVCGL